MKKQLAEVVDGTEIKETIEQKILYSCENNGAKDLCSTKNNATCGECDTTTSEIISLYRERYIRILDFRHFERFFQFSQSDRKGKKKAISDGVNVSVVLDMVSGNT